jgi:hypothetical protein
MPIKRKAMHKLISKANLIGGKETIMEKNQRMS